ncbi:hypothetical protein K450DRAFT_235319 [Umbelopsis ramanniana AG]|uniref:Uncharacterized protein n=1 Tax=Umbelopsis ramanniana AG TaxID=1314678 RepID=A0AAD5HFA8_UMBRA|nr:uncharacterized protein K450DRAFT_235319 [Umbelopsis ramanniana AG]KAI8580934.1 hypothetical protein K450DRAFT_235319 [Umbelopsis ramanniana AG]
MVCEYSPSSDSEMQPNTIVGSMSRLQKILTEQLPKWSSSNNDFKETELAERPPTPIDWESNILEGLDVLTVPQWTDQIKVTSSGYAAITESAVRKDENAVFKSVRLSGGESFDYHYEPVSRHERKMLHQIQSDLLVKEELVSHIERSQAEFIAMKNDYEERLHTLQDQIAELQQERRLGAPSPDRRIRRQSLQQPNVPTIMPVSATMREVELKKLAAEMDELRRKYNQSLSTTQTTNAKNEKQCKNYRLTIEYMKIEKKKLQHCIKEQGEKIKKLELDHNTEMARIQLERDQLLDSKTKLSKDLQAAKAALKKKSDDAMHATCQVKQMTPILDRAFRNGFVCEELPESLKSKFGQHAFANSNGPLTPMYSKSDVSTKTRANRKRQSLERMVHQYVQADQRALEYKQLLIKRNMIFMERSELASEAESVMHACGQLADTKTIELNFRMEELTKSLEMIQDRIDGYQKQFKDCTSKSGQDAVASSKGRQSSQRGDADYDMLLDRRGAYDRAMNIVRSVNAEEGKVLGETLLKEILILKCRESSRDMGTLQMDYTIQNLRKVLQSMKQSSEASRELEDNRHRNRESLGGNSMFESTKEIASLNDQASSFGMDLQDQSTLLDMINLDLKNKPSGINTYACTQAPLHPLDQSLETKNQESAKPRPWSRSVIAKRSSLRSSVKNSVIPDRWTRPFTSSSTSRTMDHNAGHRRWTLQTSYCASQNFTRNGETSTIFDRLASRHTVDC